MFTKTFPKPDKVFITCTRCGAKREIYSNQKNIKRCIPCQKVFHVENSRANNQRHIQKRKMELI